jgi:hypothetical protein
VNDFILGVDLGQAQDYTALTILERTRIDTGKTERRPGSPSVSYFGNSPVSTAPFDWSQPVYEHHYQAQYLERLAIGTPYPAQVARIKQLHDRLKTDTNTPPYLVVDQTGVGRPVVDMLRSAELSPIAVSITGGDTVSHDGLEYRVPKRDLVSAVQVLLQADRLKIAKGLPEAQTLTSELLAFKVSISLKGHDSYGNDVGPWRENPHDDLVLAVALACWYGENVKQPYRRPPSPPSTIRQTAR